MVNIEGSRVAKYLLNNITSNGRVSRVKQSSWGIICSKIFFLISDLNLKVSFLILYYTNAEKLNIANNFVFSLPKKSVNFVNGCF